MPYPHHEYLTIPFHHKAMHTDTSFSVDRTTTTHTVFMIQIDGSCSSRLADTATIPHTTTGSRRTSRISTHPAHSDTQLRPKSAYRARFVKLFSTKKQADTDLNEITNDSEATTYALQTISPRVTSSTLPIPVRPKRGHRISFRRHRPYEATPRQYAYATTSTSVESAPTTGDIPVSLTETLSEGSHTTVVSAPEGMSLRKGSVQDSVRKSVAGLPVPLNKDGVDMGMPGSPMKEAASRSHPTVRVDIVDGDASEELNTPEAGRGVDFGKKG
jgi:hypothetical protein